MGENKIDGAPLPQSSSGAADRSVETNKTQGGENVKTPPPSKATPMASTSTDEEKTDEPPTSATQKISRDDNTPKSKSTKKDARKKDVDDIAALTEGLGSVSLAPKPKELSAPEAIKNVADLLSSNKYKNIVILTGAGVSCSAGIPDFRTPGTGLYDNLAKYNLPFPEAVFELGFYRNNPEPFVQLASELWPGLKHSPTITHSFIALLEKKGLLLRTYTQVCSPPQICVAFFSVYDGVVL